MDTTSASTTQPAGAIVQSSAPIDSNKGGDSSSGNLVTNTINSWYDLMMKLMSSSFVLFLLLGLTFKNKWVGIGAAIFVQIVSYVVSKRAFEIVETAPVGGDIFLASSSSFISITAVFLILVFIMMTAGRLSYSVE